MTLITGVPRRCVRNQPSPGDPSNRAKPPPRHTPTRKMSFLRVAFRGPAASFARNRVTLSAAAIPKRTWLPQRAAFSAAPGLTKEDITTRVLDVLKGFEKVNPAKVRNARVNAVIQGVNWGLQLTAEASFTGDLGLDSLDAVEVVMAVEEVGS